MARDKFNPKVERDRQYHAFTVYRDLGFRRSYREVARLVNASPHSVSKWAALYRWKERVSEHAEVVEKKKEDGVLVKVDDPVVEKMLALMGEAEALIDSAFLLDYNGKKISQVKIKNADELTRLVAEYRKMLETYHKFLMEFRSPDKEKRKETTIREFNVNIGTVSQEERIAMMKGLVNGNVPTGNKQSEGRVQEADYTEVSERGDED